MKTFVVRAEYRSTRELVVEVPQGDPKDPATWGEILEEKEIDCSLWDVTSAEPNE